MSLGLFSHHCPCFCGYHCGSVLHQSMPIPICQVGHSRAGVVTQFLSSVLPLAQSTFLPICVMLLVFCIGNWDWDRQRGLVIGKGVPGIARGIAKENVLPRLSRPALGEKHCTATPFVKYFQGSDPGSVGSNLGGKLWPKSFEPNSAKVKGGNGHSLEHKIATAAGLPFLPAAVPFFSRLPCHHRSPCRGARALRAATLLGGCVTAPAQFLHTQPPPLTRHWPPATCPQLATLCFRAHSSPTGLTACWEPQYPPSSAWVWEPSTSCCAPVCCCQPALCAPAISLVGTQYPPLSRAQPAARDRSTRGPSTGRPTLRLRRLIVNRD